MLTTTLALATLALASGTEGEVVWFQGAHAAAIEAAKTEKKPLLTYFWANTENCSRLYSETMGDPGVAAEMREMICFSANAGDDAGRALLEKYGLETVPALLFIGADGNAEEMMTGFMNAGTFVSEIQRIKRGENTISNLRQRVAAEHEGLEEELAARKMLADKLAAVGDDEEAREMLDSVLARDKRGATVVGALAHTDRIIETIARKGGTDMAAWDLRPLAKFVQRVPEPKAKFESRLVLAGLEIDTGKRTDGVATYMRAWKERPEADGVLNSGFGIVDQLAHLGDELTNTQKQFALTVAHDLVGLVHEGEGEGEGEGDMRPYALFQVARCQQLNGANAEALATMDKVLELRPENEDYVAFRNALAETNS